MVVFAIVLTVIMATRNRWAMLARCLTAMTRLAPPPCGWRLVVADNGSEDDTQAVLKAFLPRLPLICVEAPVAGMTRAWNRALLAAEGDLIVKADDDILPAPDWLLHYRAAADRYAECAVFGGAVGLDWPAAPPPFLCRQPDLLAVLYARPQGKPGECAPDAVFGPHWAARRAVFARGFRFDEAIGPGAGPHGGACYAMGGETELFTRLRGAGMRGRYVPEAFARHIVRPEQLTEDWILARAVACGRGAARIERRRCSAMRLALWRGLARGAALAPPSGLRLRVLFTASLLAGMAEEAARGGHNIAGYANTPLRGPEVPS
jgi:hypothetical protein